MAEGSPAAEVATAADRGEDHSKTASRFTVVHASAIGVATLLALPILAIAWQAVYPVVSSAESRAIWAHLAATVLPRYGRTTLLLLIGVGTGAALVGVATAWLVTMTRFPLQRFFSWALLLPMALPAYVCAYIYTEALDYAGPVQGALRDAFDWNSRRDYWFPEIRSLGGAIFVMTLTLYPYVYLLARAAFLALSRSTLEAARTLGLGPVETVRRVALPLARPAIVVGVSLVMMEALADFGTVEHFAVATLTLGVYDAWTNMGSATAAAQLSLAMLFLAVALLAAERLARRGRRFWQRSAVGERPRAALLSGWRSAGALVACSLPVLLGFAVPSVVLVDLVLTAPNNAGVNTGSAMTSLAVAGLATIVACTLGVFLAYALRLQPGWLTRIMIRLAGAGYAVPGAVLAVGVLIPLAAFDNALDGWFRSTFGVATGLILSGSIAALLYGYTIRFLALSLGAAETGLGRITPAMDGVARTLGCSPAAVMRRVHLPILRPSLLTGGILVFVDTIKELPITLLLRPFNFETLATTLYQYAAHDRFADGAAGALLIVAVGLGPVILLARSLERGGEAVDGASC